MCPGTVEKIVRGSRRAAIVLAGLLVGPLIGACSVVPAGGHADLAPTLSFKDAPGGPVAFQNGQPVPTFDRQPRLTSDLDGTWRFDREAFDSSVSLTRRGSVMPVLTAELG